jgi:hypothetical protein
VRGRHLESTRAGLQAEGRAQNGIRRSEFEQRFTRRCKGRASGESYQADQAVKLCFIGWAYPHAGQKSWRGDMVTPQWMHGTVRDP